MRALQTFVVRILQNDELGFELSGQLSEPASADEWRTSFYGVQELFEQILTRLAAGPHNGASDTVTPQTLSNPTPGYGRTRESNE